MKALRLSMMAFYVFVGAAAARYAVVNPHAEGRFWFALCGVGALLAFCVEARDL